MYYKKYLLNRLRVYLLIPITRYQQHKLCHIVLFPPHPFYYIHHTTTLLQQHRVFIMQVHEIILFFFLFYFGSNHEPCTRFKAHGYAPFILQYYSYANNRPFTRRRPQKIILITNNCRRRRCTSTVAVGTRALCTYFGRSYIRRVRNMLNSKFDV